MLAFLNRLIVKNFRAKSALQRYGVIDDKAAVELKLKTPRQLFDERDPAPFRERDLDDDAARYITASYRDVRDVGSVKLKLHFESLGELEGKSEVIERAIHAFFSFEADMKRRELIDTFRLGLISLSIGLTFLFTCVYVTTIYFAEKRGDASGPLWQTMIHEGLFIMGWVAMWKPISIFLYEWWPIRDALKTYKRLSTIEIEILPMTPNNDEAAKTSTQLLNTLKLKSQLA